MEWNISLAMSEADRERLRAHMERYPLYDENGIDLSLIRNNLALTPTERLRQADAHRRSAERLMEIGRQNRTSAA